MLDERSLPRGPPAASGEHDAYFQPAVSDERRRCSSTARAALDRSLAVGAHGLPLIGTRRLERRHEPRRLEGRGESVWLGWFLHATCSAVRAARRARAASERAPRLAARTRPRSRRRSSATAGTATGTGAPTSTTARRSARRERRMPDRLDRAVVGGDLRGGGPGARARGRWPPSRSTSSGARDGLALLFTPPFDRTPLDPGYIKGYPPGIRENGGQYTQPPSGR